jgi:hypothetical protein
MIACGSACASGNDWIIEPGARFGPLTGTTTIAELPDLFGKENVKLMKRPGPEGSEPQDVVVLYSETSDEVEVHFDAEAGGKVISAEAKGGRWKISNGLGVGSTLAEIEKLNEKPITFLGVNWDYGGFITSYNEGKLEPAFSGDKPLGLRLGIEGDAPAEIVGDQEVRSDNDGVPKDKLKVVSIYFQLYTDPDP